MRDVKPAQGEQEAHRQTSREKEHLERLEVDGRLH
jgi:hypothetical protein